MSRLLSKSIGQRDDAPPISDSMRTTLSSHRRRLLSKIDSILTTLKSSLQELVDAMCAFCIITSSSSTDAIRHLQDLRLGEIRRLSGTHEQWTDDLVAGFEYYLQSLQTTRQLLGRRLSDALRDLRSKPVLESPDVQSIEHLKADNLHRFVPTEILTFVPWIKHEEVGDGEALSLLDKWSKAAFEAFYSGLQREIGALSDTSEVLSFRTRLLQIWLSACVSTPTHSNLEIFHSLRSALNARMTDLIHARANLLSAIASDIESQLEIDTEDDPASLKSIWADDVVKAPLGKGSASFKRQLTNRLRGQSRTTDTILSSVQTWATSVTLSMDSVNKLRKERWIDIIEESDEVDEDETIEKIETALQTDDPNLYDHEHSASLSGATLQFQNRVKEAGNQLATTEARKAVFLLRTIRGIHEILATRPTSFPQLDLRPLFSAVPHLHHILATETTTKLFRTLQPSTFALKPQQTRALSQHLWEGNPPLPTQPSPRIFKLLQHLTSIMAQQGPDLWSATAVAAVKRAVRRELLVRGLFQPEPEPEPEPKLQPSPPQSPKQPKKTKKDDDPRRHEQEENDDDEDNNKNPSTSPTSSSTILLAMIPTQTTIQIQTLFDMLYLSNALHVDVDEHDHDHYPISNPDTNNDDDDNINNNGGSWTSTIHHLHHRKASQSSSSARSEQRPSLPELSDLEARASQYWGRSRLLFGLL
jgi:conserved oligomeric Golgi complex subunit 1